MRSAAFTEVPGQLTRRYLSRAQSSHAPGRGLDGRGRHERAHRSAAQRVRPLRGQTPGGPAIMIGSHIDTVVDAGRYDGGLGVLAAIAVVAELARTRRAARSRHRGRGVRRGGGLALPHPHPHLLGADRRGQAGAARCSGRRRASRVREALAAAGRRCQGLPRLRPQARARSPPTSSCTSSRGRCWRRRAWRWPPSRPSTAPCARSLR